MDGGKENALPGEAGQGKGTKGFIESDSIPPVPIDCKTFSNLFAGADHAYAICTITGEQRGDGKVKAKYVTKDFAPTDQTWTQHLPGVR